MRCQRLHLFMVGASLPFFLGTTLGDITTASSTVFSATPTNSSTALPWYLAHHCYPYSNPDFNGNNVCQCEDPPLVYPQNTIGTTPASLYQGACYATAPPATTTEKTGSDCPVWGPPDCHKSDINIQSAINAGQDRYKAAILSNCTDFQYHSGYPGPDADSNGDNCAEVLPIEDHMLWWWKENSAVCQEHQVTFANCFMDRVPSRKYDASNCANLAGNYYCSKPDHHDFTGANGTLDFYVAWNIYNFAIWADTYYNAIYHSGFLAGQQVWNISDTFIQPKKGLPEWAMILLYVLTFALGLISPSGWGKGLGSITSTALGDAGRAAASSAVPFTNFWRKLGESPWEYVLRAAQQAPALIGHLVPQASDDGIHALMSSADIEAKLGDLIEGLATTMVTVAKDIPGNVTAFAEWTHFGYYYSEPVDIQTMTDTLKESINMFVLSQMLENDGFIIARQLDTDPQALFTNGSKGFDRDLINCPEYDKYGMCNDWWHYSENGNNVAYSLLQPDRTHEHNSWTKQIHQVFDLGLTTPDNLFMGSQLCSIGWNSTKGEVPGPDTVQTPGSVVTTCLSNLQVCTWNLHDGSQEFTEGKNCSFYEFFAMPECKGGRPWVPTGYLGYYLFHGAQAKSCT